MTRHPLEKTLKHWFGYDSFRPLQRDIIVNTLNGNDSLVLIPTGGGKSICYQLPAVILPGLTIVVSPLISLMKDQVQSLQNNGIAAFALNSSLPPEDVDNLFKALAKGEIKILYLSPERLVSEEERLKSFGKVSLIAIDEAHCISQWGHDFRPEYTRLSFLRTLFPETPVMALTATADKVTRNDILSQLHINPGNVFISSFDRPNLSLDVRQGLDSNEKFRAIKGVIDRHPDESGIIYCLSRKNTEQLAEKLRAAGYDALPYHAGLSNQMRDKVQDDFINDRIHIVVATIAFGMGIDKSDVRYVIHYNLPKSIESFYQEIGRGGRDGLECETLLFFNYQDLVTLRSFAENSGQQQINLEKLSRMEEYAEARVCRRKILLNYFGEPSETDCGNCDVCQDPPERFDGTVPVQMALSAVARSNQNIDLPTTVEILRGQYTARVKNAGYHLLKTFGVGHDTPPRHWRDYLLQMLQSGIIEIAYDKERHLVITPLGLDILYGRKKALLAIPKEINVKKRVKKGGRNRPAPGLSLNDEGLFAPSPREEHNFRQLKNLRLEIAREKNVPPYIIFTDKTLRHLAASLPDNTDEFLKIPGVGSKKLELYAPRFISLINELKGE